MNALELADELAQLIQPPSLIDDAWAKDIIFNAYAMLRKLEGQLAFRIDAVMRYQAKVEEQQAEIEALKSKLNKYHLKEDLDRNLNLIYGKAFIK